MESENDKLTSKRIELNYKQFIEDIYKPQTRHKYEIRQFIRDNGNIVYVDELMDFMREEYNYTDKIITKMLLELEKENIIMALFIDNEFDLRYTNYKEKYFK